jgi:hypothetical protein
MTMHLVGPWLNTSGKKKGKKKWPSAEAKRRAEQLEQDWQDLKKRHSAEQHEKKRVRAMTAPTYTEPTRTHRGANDPKPKSLNTWITGAVGSKPAQQYSGDKVLGITIVHKSCLQPVFSQQEAIDAAKMRR